MQKSVLTVQDFFLGYRESHQQILNNINMQINAGECCCVIGKTGSGKSSLLLAIAGLLDQEIISGTIQKNGHVGIILQNPETQLLSHTVGEEIAFGLENLCVAPDHMTPLINEVLQSVGLEKPLSFPVKHLSMGQKYRLIMASHLVMSPQLILLDEPSGQLDQPGIDKLSGIIAQLKEKNVSFLICEHNTEKLKTIVDNFFVINNQGSLNTFNLNSIHSNHNIHHNFSFCIPFEETIIQADNLTIGYKNHKTIVSNFNLTVNKGDIVSICGKNGTGKTSLIRTFCGFMKPTKGVIKIFGKSPTPKALRFQMGLLFQNPQKQLFETTVFKELSFQLLRLHLSPKTIEKRIIKILKQFDIEHLIHDSPFKLSFGQKHLIIIASILAARPEIIILDDPFAGIDHLMVYKIINVLSKMNHDYRTTIIWTSHDPEAFSFFSTQRIVLESKK